MPERVLHVLSCVVIRRVNIVNLQGQNLIPEVRGTMPPSFSGDLPDNCDAQFQEFLEALSAFLCVAFVVSSLLFNFNLVETMILGEFCPPGRAILHKFYDFSGDQVTPPSQKPESSKDTHPILKAPRGNRVYTVMPVRVMYNRINIDHLRPSRLRTLRSFDQETSIPSPPTPRSPKPKIYPTTPVSSDTKSSDLINKIDFSKPPQLLNSGNTTIVYSFNNSQDQPVAIFKPTGIEQSRLTTLNSSSGSSPKLSLTTREQIRNELAAYLLSKPDNFVPFTEIITLPQRLFNPNASGTTEGSLQTFIPDAENCEDLGPGLFDVEQIQKIAILDLRILNLDRHPGNLLLKDKKLYAIDHALSFPTIDELKDVTYDWLYYKQSKTPLTESNLALLKAIDPYKDAELLQNLGVSNERIIPAFASSVLLKLLAANGETLFDIGSKVQRDGDRATESKFERVLRRVIEEVGEVDEVLDTEKLEKLEKELEQAWNVDI